MGRAMDNFSLFTSPKKRPKQIQRRRSFKGSRRARPGSPFGQRTSTASVFNSTKKLGPSGFWNAPERPSVLRKFTSYASLDHATAYIQRWATRLLSYKRVDRSACEGIHSPATTKRADGVALNHEGPVS